MHLSFVATAVGFEADEYAVVCGVVGDDGRYLTFQVDVEQAEDPTRYDVWVAWDEECRKQAIVRLGQFLGVGLGRASEMLDEGRPLATGLPALEVTALATRYRAAGLDVRVCPKFRWLLP